MTLLIMMALGLIALAALFTLYRLVFGPTNADRIVSADAMALITTVILIIIAMIFGSSLYLDIALVYSILSFVGVIALARVIEAKIQNNSLNKQGED
jgi:multicomponent Na+:H+ antiporter subunit F